MTLNYAEAIYALDDSSLDVYQSRVWLRVLRRKVCFESQRNMAEGIGISLGKVNQALQWLLENGWIVRDVDKRTQKVGYVAVLPDEQTQQNSLHDVNDVLPDEHDVLPDERHLKAKESKQNNKTRVDETLIALFEGLTAFTAPHETTDMYTDDWLKPVQAIFSQSKDYAEAEERITYAIQHLRKIRYTIISPNSILKTALNWQSGDKPGGRPSINSSDATSNDKAIALENIRKAVQTHGARRYKQAMSMLQEPEQAIVKKMAPTWRDVCMMDSSTFQVRYYQALKGA